MDALFTINLLGLPSKFCCSLGTANLIESSHSSMPQLSANVKHWRIGSMAPRWTAISKTQFCRIMGHQNLLMLQAALHEPKHDHQLAEAMKASEHQLTPKPPPPLSTELGTSSQKLLQGAVVFRR
ncbi:MAG: hypothetical protein KDA93_08190, partial [Planctomycetaceae bacterium]|nr:hypothetical protein [Planctomycetaceae bacterium]